jgi:signal peptidase I
VRSGRTEILDPPGSSEEFPRWLTLREASFLTGLDEVSLRALVASGRVGCDRSLSRRLGEGYLLLPSKDLQAAGLLSTDSTAPSAQAEPVLVLTPEVASPVVAPARPLAAALPGLGDWARVALRWAEGGLLAGLVVASFLPLLHGYRTFAVTSGQMAPSVRSGDLVLDRAVAVDAVRAGDVVTFVDPDTHRSITTRIRSTQRTDGEVRFEGRGDNDQNVLRWSVPADTSINRVVGRVWGLGAPLALIPGHVDRRVPFALPAVSLVVATIVWRRRRRAATG